MKSENRILIVDDNELLITLIKSFNTFWELDIDYSFCAEDAMTKIKKNSYHLLFLDMQLPDATGADIIPLIKDIRPEIKIVIISGENQKKCIRKSKACEYDGYLQKPFKMSDLLIAITQFENRKVNHN